MPKTSSKEDTNKGKAVLADRHARLNRRIFSNFAKEVSAIKKARAERPKKKSKTCIHCGRNL